LEAEAGGLQVQGQPKLQSKTLSHNNNDKKLPKTQQNNKKVLKIKKTLCIVLSIFL
jgi:hypothetical protein